MATRITSQEWEAHRPEIIKLYVVKGYHLKVVRQRLANQGFHASETQYRTRFKIWNVRKPKKANNSKDTAGSALTPPDRNTDHGDSDHSSEAEIPTDQIFSTNLPPECSHKNQSCLSGRRALDSLSAEARPNPYDHNHYGFPNIYDPWRPTSCNCGNFNDVVPSSLDPSMSFTPPNDRYLYCPSWVEKSTKVSSLQHISNADIRNPSFIAPRSSENPSNQADFPIEQLSAQETHQQTSDPLLSDSFLFSWP